VPAGTHGTGPTGVNADAAGKSFGLNVKSVLGFCVVELSETT
jgi:hypothetical protein